MQLSPYAQRVLDAVEQIPRGHVMTYGDIAEWAGTGPRQVGAVLREYGGPAPWWRVVRADGSPAPLVARRALERLREDGVPLLADGTRVDLRRARWSGIR